MSLIKLNSRYARSSELLDRALRVIPLGSQTFSKSHLVYPKGQAPLFLTHGKGSRVWDVDGNEYIDFVNGLLPVVLGYGDPDVNEAVQRQLREGVVFSLASEHEVELAEELVDLIPCAEMVRFGKNGSDATAGAVRLARAYTGRDRVAVCGYHGWQDWYIGSTPRNKGVPRAVRELTHPFRYNDLASLEKLFQSHSGEFAAVIMEPMNTEEPKPGFLEGVRDLTRKHGALLIFDEIITGFRFHLGGAQALFGVIPDLATFGKSMGNGFPISAVVGRCELMKEMEEIFYSFTFGGETLSLVASLATIRKMRREPVIETIWSRGQVLMGGIRRLISRHELQDVFSVTGKPCWFFLNTVDARGFTSFEIKTLFFQEILRRGVLMVGSHNMSYAHTEKDIEIAIGVYDEALFILRKALADGDLRNRLQCPPLEPLFKVR